MLISSFSKAVSRSFFGPQSQRSFSRILDRNYLQKTSDKALSKNELINRKVKFVTAEKETVHIDLYGVPVHLLPDTEDGMSKSVRSLFTEQEESPIFLQIDPTRYIFSQRHAALQEESITMQTEGLQEMLSRDPISPFTWDETIVHYDILAKYMKTEDAEKIFDLEFLQESVKNSQSTQGSDATARLAKIIQDQVLDNKLSPYYEMNNILMYSMALKNEIILGGFPKILKRLVLGNSFTVKELQEIFRVSCQMLQYNKDEVDLTLSDVVRYLAPDVVKTCELLYLAIYLKEIAKQTKKGFKAFLGIDYVDIIADNWNCLEFSGEFEDVAGIPARQEGETVDNLIEKQVILDLLLEEQIWDLPYLKNQFPYLSETENTDATIMELRKKFYINYQKYNMAKDHLLKAPINPEDIEGGEESESSESSDDEEVPKNKKK